MTERRILTVGQHRLASPAPPARDDDLPRETASDAHIDALATAWVRWHATRRFYGRDPRLFTPLGRLQPRGSSGRQPDAFASSELATFHVAVLSVPEDSIGRKVFEAHYLLRARPVAKAAAQLGISRPSWYKVLRRVRREIYATHARLLSSV